MNDWEECSGNSYQSTKSGLMTLKNPFQRNLLNCNISPKLPIVMRWPHVPCGQWPRWRFRVPCPVVGQGQLTHLLNNGLFHIGQAPVGIWGVLVDKVIHKMTFTLQQVREGTEIGHRQIELCVLQVSSWRWRDLRLWGRDHPRGMTHFLVNSA